MRELNMREVEAVAGGITFVIDFGFFEWVIFEF
jgi:hypothetical protein